MTYNIYLCQAVRWGDVLQLRMWL